MDNEDDQTARMCSLIQVLVGHTSEGTLSHSAAVLFMTFTITHSALSYLTRFFS